MQGLPAGIGALGGALLVAGLAFGAAYAAYAFRRLRAAFAPATNAAAVAAVAAAALGVGLGAAPFVAWRVVEDLRYTTGLDPWLAERYGVSVSEIHPSLYDRARTLVPAGDTFAVVVDARVSHERREAFEQWALTTLLPRRAVSDPAAADWLLTLGVAPAEVGPSVGRAVELHPGAGEVPPAYLARVRS